MSRMSYARRRRVISVAALDVWMVEHLFAPQGYSNIEIYHQAMWSLFLPLLLLILACYVYLSRRIRYGLDLHGPSLADALIFIFSAFLLLYLGGVDVAYYLLQGKPIPETLPWLDETPVAFFRQSSHEHVTRVDLLISFTVAVAATLLLALSPWENESRG